MTFEKYSHYNEELCSNPMNQSSYLESFSAPKYEEEPDSDFEKHSETSNGTHENVHEDTHENVHEDTHENVHEDTHQDVHEDTHQDVHAELNEEEEELDLSERHLVDTLSTENQKETTRFPQGHQVFYVAQDVENFKQDNNSDHRIEKKNHGQSQPFTVRPSHPDLPYLTPLSIHPQQYQATTNFHTTYPPNVTGYSIKHVPFQNPYAKYPPTPWPYRHIETEPISPCVAPPWGSYRGTPPTQNPHYVPYTNTHFLHYRQPPSFPVLQSQFIGVPSSVM